MDVAFLSRFEREKKTIGAMIRIYCSDLHRQSQALCDDCAALQAYALFRLDKCPFGSAKPTCAKCIVHCYKPTMREKVRLVMRQAGPRMTLRHPILAVFHVIDSYIYKPRRKGGRPVAAAD